MEKSGKRRVYVAGVAMTEFKRPGSKNNSYHVLGSKAVKHAISDANAKFTDVQAVVASYCYGEPTCGQRVMSEIGLPGVPIFNVNNNCSSGSSALMLARKLVISGYDCVLAVGFETMESGLSIRYPEKENPWSPHIQHMESLGIDMSLLSPHQTKTTSDVIKMFAHAAREYFKQNPQATINDLYEIASKNRRHGALNSKAMLRQALSPEYIAKKTMLCEPLNIGCTALTADGAAAALVVSDAFLRRHGAHGRPVEMLSQHMTTDLPSSFESSIQDLLGLSMAREAARLCYEESGVRPTDVDVLEVHDCFASNELMMYEALGLAPKGRGCELIRASHWRRNPAGNELCYLADRWVVNPSGGLISKGHPIGATGLAQCYELVRQLRGTAGANQVPGATVGLQHNFGLGSACVVTLYVARGLPLNAAQFDWPRPSSKL